MNELFYFINLIGVSMLKILIIDDADYILEGTSALLKLEGFEIYTSLTGAEGLRIAEQNKPDLIICDISMPEMDGFQVLKHIRSNNSTRFIPFIFLTAFTDRSQIRTGMLLGADDYLFKPFSRDELLMSISAQLKKHLLIAEHYQKKAQELRAGIIKSLPHEFRTALNQISGLAYYLKSNSDKISTNEVDEIAGEIIQSTARLSKITENYLTLTTLDLISYDPEKRQSLRKYFTDEPCGFVVDMAEGIATSFNRQNDLEIISIVPNIKIEVAGENFHKIIYELIENAFKFSTPQSRVTISMYLDNSFLFFEICDKGRGMSEDQISKIGEYIQFERELYEQQGLGFGLTIASKLVLLHGGIFEIISNQDSGILIKFSLPCH